MAASSKTDNLRGVIPNLPPGLFKTMELRRMSKRQVSTPPLSSKCNFPGKRRASSEKAKLEISASYKALEEHLSSHQSSSPTTEDSDYFPKWAPAPFTSGRKANKRKRSPVCEAQKSSTKAVDEMYKLHNKDFKGCPQRYSAFTLKTLPMVSSPERCVEFMRQYFSYPQTISSPTATYTTLLHRKECQKVEWEAVVVTFDPSALTNKKKLNLYITRPRHRSYPTYPNRTPPAGLAQQLFQTNSWGHSSRFLPFDMFHPISDSVPNKSKPRKLQGSRKRKTRACTSCQRRKKKCDQRYPSCGRCAQKNDKCAYSDSLTGTDELSDRKRPSKGLKTVDQKILSSKRPFEPNASATISRHSRNSQHHTQFNKNLNSTCRESDVVERPNASKEQMVTKPLECGTFRPALKGTPRRPGGGLVYPTSPSCSMNTDERLVGKAHTQPRKLGSSKNQVDYDSLPKDSNVLCPYYYFEVRELPMPTFSEERPDPVLTDIEKGYESENEGYHPPESKYFSNSSLGYGSFSIDILFSQDEIVHERT